MFVWTAESVLAAIDAGINPVIATFNRAYTMAWTNGVALHGTRRNDLVPTFSARGAYTIAMDQTIAILSIIEAEALADRISTGAEMAMLDAALAA